MVRVDPAVARPRGRGRGRPDPAGSSGQALRRDGQAAGRLAAPRAADRLRGRRADRRHESQAAVRGGGQRPANARRVRSAARRPGRAATCSSPRCGATARRSASSATASTPILGRLRFAGGLSSRRLETGLEADVLATYNDGSAGIVLTSSDAGALAVINADLAASNLPKTSAFVPLLAELVEQMLDRASRGRRGALRRAAGGPSAGRGRRGGRACASAAPDGAGRRVPQRRPLRRIGRRGRGRAVALAVARAAGRVPRRARRHDRVRHRPSTFPPKRASSTSLPARRADRPAGRGPGGRRITARPTRASAATISGSGSPWRAWCAFWVRFRLACLPHVDVL